MRIIASQICPHCHKEFIVERTPQTAGYRDIEELHCHFCGELLESSMEWVYGTEEPQIIDHNYYIKKVLRKI